MRESRPPNVVEHVLVAYALTSPEPSEALRARLDRVERHFEPLIEGGLRREETAIGSCGVVLWRRRDQRIRWPLWDREGDLTAAWANAPTGWHRLLGEVPPGRASVPAARRLAAEPAVGADLNPPYLFALANASSGVLDIVQDPLGLGRIYEMQTADGWIWSNRLGALPLFGGCEPHADRRGWLVLAAAGWFLGETTPIEGVRKLQGGARIRIDALARVPVVSHGRSTLRDRLVEPRNAGLEDSAEAAAAQAVEATRDVSRLWDAPAEVDLTGGRDSRVSAAAAVASGIDGTYQTVDADPGELETASRLAEIAGVADRHVALDAEPESADAGMRDRLAYLHRFHDGMVNPQAGGRGAILPVHRGYDGPVVSGHGGELGHGFYYRSPERLAELRGKGLRAMTRRLVKMARKDGNAGRPEAIDAYREEVVVALEEGRAAGIRGPALLDWFYLSQRLAHRSGLAVRSDRYSACATPAFVRACFDIRPHERLDVVVHRGVVSNLVPDWDEVPFFAGPGTQAGVRYRRVWERDSNVDYLGPLIEQGGAWEELFEPGRVRELWAKARAGGGNAHHERLFLRIAWRESFEEHLRALAGAARA